MHDDDLRLEIKRLAFRLQRIERRIGIEPASDEEPSEATVRVDSRVKHEGSVEVPPRAEMPAHELAERERPAAPPTAPPRTPVSTPPIVPSRSASPAPLMYSIPVKPPRQVAAPVERSEKHGGSIESAIGIKVLGGIGAILVVIGAAFLAREYGTNIWLSLPAWMQALSIASFAALLLLGGEIALRKLGRPASLGLYGAGLGVLYMDAFATFEWFEIVSQDVAFLLMGLVAACGFAITLRTRFLSIGVLSLIGGYLTPLVLWRADVEGLFIAAFLTMLAGIALALSAWQSRPYRPLRYVAFAGQCLLGLMVLAESRSEPVVALIFFSTWWSMFTAEAVFAAMRRQSPIGNVVISLLGTAAYVTCAAWILNFFTNIGSEYLGAFTAMIGALCVAIALHFGPGLEALRGRLATAMDKLAVALWAQFGVLLTIAIAMQFDGFGPSVGWLVLGLAAIEIGRRLPSSGVTVFGLIVGALGIARIVTIDQLSTPLQVELWSAADLTVDRWAILALLGIVAIHAAAKRIGGGRAFEEVFPVLLAVTGAFAWLGLAALRAEDTTLTALWFAGGIVMLLAAPLGKRERYFEISLALLIATCGMWLLTDAFAHRASALIAQQTAIFNVRFGMGLLLIGALAVAAMLSRRWSMPQAQRIAIKIICMAMIGIIAFALGTAEIDHAWRSNTMARQTALSMYWIVFGIVLVLLGFVRLSAACRYIGLALLFFTIVKVLLVDLQTVDRMWRIASSIVSGLLLIGTAMVYARLSPKLLATLATKTHAPS